MNIFQQQFLSVLQTAASTKHFGKVEKGLGLSKDKQMKKDMSEELGETGLSKETNKFLTNETLRAQDKDPMSPAAMAYTEIQDNLIGLSRANKKQVEEIAGLRAQVESQQAMRNKVAAKQHKITDKEFQKEFYKRAKPIPHGGKQ